MLTRDDFTEDQELAIDRLYNHNETLLIAPTGIGKTTIVLTAISELIEANELSRVLVIAPLKVCLTTWLNETQKWDHLSNLRFSVAAGRAPVDRMWTLSSTNSSIVVLNEENAAWAFEKGLNELFDGIVIDETSRWRHTGGVRLKALRNKMQHFKWRVGMTAEPVSENWVGLFGQMLMIDLGKALGRSRDRYLRKYFYPTDYDQRNWELLPGKEDLLADRIRSVVHIMPDYKEAELPKKIITEHFIDLPSEAWRRYNRMRIDSILKIDDNEILAGSKAVLSGKLEQIAAGFSYLDEESEDGEKTAPKSWGRPVFSHHMQKTDWVIARAREIVACGESVIVVYWFQYEYECLKVLLPDALSMNGTPKEIQRSMDEWRERPGQIMLLQPSSASHGVDGLQDTCFRQLWLNPIWSNDKTNQCGDRLWRRGQTRDVEIEICIARGTVDEIKRASVVNNADYHELFLKHLSEE